MKWLDKSDKYWILIAIFFMLFMIVGKRCSGQQPEAVESMIRSYGIQFPKIVTAQALLESGNFNCSNCSWECCNNAFGFHNGKRYLQYDNLEHCIEGYQAWQNWRCPDCRSEEEYYQCLIKYWGAPNMERYVKRIRQKAEDLHD